MEPLLLVALALLPLAWLIGAPLLRMRRRARLQRQPFPGEWRAVLRRSVPLVARLPADLQLRLKKLMQVFLAEKSFVGCGGLTVTLEMRLTIAALACLPLLGAARGLYPRLQEILVYPGAFVVQRSQLDAAGLQTESRQVLSGESWGRGQVVLSWADVQRDALTPGDGRNVVVHEFAHQLDQAKGFANGAPALRDRAAYARWSRVMQVEFDSLRWRAAQGLPSLLSDYGASEPAEFFAVASEVFFERPLELAEQHPALYQELARFYRLDPFSWH